MIRVGGTNGICLLAETACCSQARLGGLWESCGGLRLLAADSCLLVSIGAVSSDALPLEARLNYKLAAVSCQCVLCTAVSNQA